MNNMRAESVPAQTGIVGRGVSYKSDPEKAVFEAVAQLGSSKLCFVMVFVPDCLDLDGVAAALVKALPSTSVFGCTTAGQITPSGYENSALLIISFPRAHFRCSSALIGPLRPMSIAKTAKQAETLSKRFSKSANWNRLALVVADGMSKQEDVLVAALEAGLGDIPVFGGSAGNGLSFDSTFVFHEGKFHEHSAMLILIETDMEFSGIGFDHFLPTEKHMVVTQAEPDERLVQEINGSPAASEYARLVGCKVEELSPRIFAENPVLVRNGNAWHVRAIQQVVDGHHLSFLSAIDDGLLLTLGRGKEILRTLDTELSLERSGERPDIILGFDCVLRKLEIEQKDIVEEASAILSKHRVLGFNTYGEQHRGVHVNQTFVGVAFYPPKPEVLF